jgi:hypothetical protein
MRGNEGIRIHIILSAIVSKKSIVDASVIHAYSGEG